MLRATAAGCGFLLLFAVGFGLWVHAMAGRIAPPIPDSPVSVDGDCPHDEALAWAKAHSKRSQVVVSIMEEMDPELADGASRNRRVRLGADLDVEAAFPAMHDMATEDVPACVADLRDAAVEYYTISLRTVTLLSQGSPWSRAAHQFTASTAMLRGYSGRRERVEHGYMRLGERLGEDLSEYAPYPNSSE